MITSNNYTTLRNYTQERKLNFQNTYYYIRHKVKDVIKINKRLYLYNVNELDELIKNKELIK